MAPRNDSAARSVGRPADRQNQILQEMRGQIVGGEFAPGSRLPTREEMARTYNSSTHTVQRALDKLKSDGFIESNERGTRVSLKPPHLNHYAVVFPGLPDDGSTWVRFWTVLNEEAKRLQNIAGNQLSLYYDVSSDPKMADYQALLANVMSHSVAGIIFVTFPHRLVGTPLLDEPGIPRVGIMAPTVRPTIPAITLDMTSFYEQSLALLRDRGCRRVAFLNPPGVHADTSELLKMVETAGLTSQTYWNLRGHLLFPETSQDLMRLLFQGPKSTRPDGLVIGDDNLVEQATEGIRLAGVQVPQDLEIVAHSNFPLTPPSSVPLTYLGFDAQEILQNAVSQIDALRQGRPIVEHTRIAARFADQLAKSPAQVSLPIN